eukprot:7062183-Prymnesium_polylepis.1
MAAAATLEAVEGERVPWRAALPHELAPLVAPRTEMHWPVPRLQEAPLSAMAVPFQDAPRPPATAMP